MIHMFDALVALIEAMTIDQKALFLWNIYFIYISIEME